LFGEILANDHLSVRHVPYTTQGIETAHVAHINSANAVVFIMTGLLESGVKSQLTMAMAAQRASADRPFVVVACFPLEERMLPFCTLIQANGFGENDLRAASRLFCSGYIKKLGHPYNDGDISRMYELSKQETPDHTHLQLRSFSSILRLDGYIMVFIARNADEVIVGFAVISMTYSTSEKEPLLGSITAIMVEQKLRRRGIGRCLYRQALRYMYGIRGLSHIQLGGTFPRLLQGIPCGSASIEWFYKIGWCFDQTTPGRGNLISDWLLELSHENSTDFVSAGFQFRNCLPEDKESIIALAKKETDENHRFGFVYQYTRLLEACLMRHIQDIRLGFIGSTLLAAAIIHTPDGGNPTTNDIPFPELVRSSVGGISCICVRGQST
jgi:GNAT superfamily N-acetyltransferase